MAAVYKRVGDAPLALHFWLFISNSDQPHDITASPIQWGDHQRWNAWRSKRLVSVCSCAMYATHTHTHRHSPCIHPPPTNQHSLLELPDELLVAVLAHLPTSERARCALVCHRMASVLSTTPAWRSISICTSRWSTLKETKIDTWLTQRTGIRTVHHLQLGSPQYRVRLQRTSLINHIHGLLNGLQRVDVQHVEPFAAGRLLMGAPGLIHANLTGAACNDPELRTLTAADVRCHQLTSLTLHAPDGVVMPSWPMFLSTLQHLAFISLAAPGAHWQVPDDDISTLQRLSSLHLHGMDMVALPSTLTTLTALTEMRLLRVKRVEGLVHVPNGLHVLHTDGVRWLGGLAALVGRLHELRVLRVSASGRAEMLPQVLMQLCKLEVLCLREDAAEHHGDDIPLMDGDEVPHDGEHHHHHEGQQHVLSLSLDTLAPLKALREVELSGSGRELHVEGQQVCRWWVGDPHGDQHNQTMCVYGPLLVYHMVSQPPPHSWRCWQGFPTSHALRYAAVACTACTAAWKS